ncbi:MAG: MFS transporter [SAR202 cluster bacterium]|nr:MFS transporter [SAR202 cluster bacterium]
MALITSNTAWAGAPPRSHAAKAVLRASVLEGVAFGVFVGLGESYITAFALAAGASPLVVSLIASLPVFLAAGAQLAEDRMVRVLGGRRRAVVCFAALQALAVGAYAVSGVARPAGLPWLLIALAALYALFGAVIAPAWGGIMADLVPPQLRGRYFALRSQLSTLAMVVSFIGAGAFLNQVVDHALWGFAIVFGAAALARGASWLLLRRLPSDGALSTRPRRQHVAPSETDASARVIRRFIVFMFAMHFCVNISGPFFVYYQLRELEISYLWFSLLQAVASMATLLAVRRWGRFADKAGNRLGLVVASLLLPAIPLLWIPFPHVGAFMVAQVLSGVA